MCRTYHAVNYLDCGHSIKVTEAIFEITPHRCNAEHANWHCPQLEYIPDGVDEPHKCSECLDDWAAGMEDAYVVIKKEWKPQLLAKDWEVTK